MAQQILVCNDEPHVVRAISLKLTRAGFDVKGVNDARTCWQYLNTHDSPALFIVDFATPHSAEGTELARQIRSDRRLANLPVIALIDNVLPTIEQSDLLHSLEILEVFTKPFSPREVLATVQRLLGHEPPQHACHFDREYLTCR